METKRLNNGSEIPCLGLGTWQLRGREAEQAVKKALELGYRHIDTAAYYANETEIGRAVRESGVDREQVFITTKLWPDQFDNPRGSLKASLAKLQTGYVDQYLIHWPRGNWQKAWGELEALQTAGLAKSIGVSNFSVTEIDELLATAKTPPAVNQIEFSPLSPALELNRHCQQLGLAVVAYSPLAKGRLLDDEVVTELAEKHGKTPAQIVLRWSLEHGAIVIPKSARAGRIQENSRIFDFKIEPQEVERLDQLQ